MKIGGTLEWGVENRMSTAMEKSSKNDVAVNESQFAN